MRWVTLWKPRRRQLPKYLLLAKLQKQQKVVQLQKQQTEKLTQVVVQQMKLAGRNSPR